MKLSQACTWLSSMYSLGWCAWRMLPGPQITVGIPTSWKSPASVP